MLKLLQYLWAFPTTLPGLIVVSLAITGGGRVQVVDGVLEARGPYIAWLLGRMPLVRGAAALTLGHVVLAVDQAALESTRAHERIHVAQCERWGPLFIPAYLISSLNAALRGRDPYYDNPFEREAFLKS